MTKAFLHGRTEAIRSVQPQSVNFTKVRTFTNQLATLVTRTAYQMFYSEATASEKVAALRKACEWHVQLTKECSQGLGQDR